MGPDTENFDGSNTDGKGVDSILEELKEIRSSSGEIVVQSLIKGGNVLGVELEADQQSTIATVNSDKLCYSDAVSINTGTQPMFKEVDAGYQHIYSEASGLRINAILTTPNGTDVNGHRYNAIVGNVQMATVQFQQGSVPENGINGLTNEALLAILIHRTEFLDNKFPCAENKLAIESMKDALRALEERTRKRVARGVEGKHEE